MKLEEKKMFSLGSFKFCFFFCEKSRQLFLSFPRFFLLTNILKQLAIANNRPLFATLSRRENE